ncbi:hypothetical protein HGRIS_006378 [Hohenbuehelia grisea]|uniref:DNA mismatch repair proteins mutS family domain-containing protein n=1 Tax=Hohenbuehelia grisea TaxID=104357 RepID=A0ABR3K245_9AGAR
MHDMDTHIGDLHSAIIDREIEILQELLERVLTYTDVVITACDVCAELDCLLAFASASRAYDYRRPCMVEANTIHIIQGRHPLHEQVVDTFVPNDAHLIGGRGTHAQTLSDAAEDSDNEVISRQHSVVLLTGANGCGKSVYLKQIALIQIMAQIGCFVPAESATLGVVDKIFTRLSTKESISKAQSAFMIDLNQVSLAIRNCTARSLVILDEFGKGTMSTDGAGLFCAVLQHLLDRGPECPKVLTATHFHDIFGSGMLDPTMMPITMLHMQVMFVVSGNEVQLSGTPSDNQELRRAAINEKITYLYRVAEGLALDSHAAKCAQLCGIPLRIIERAQYVSDLVSKHEIRRLLDEEMTEEERMDLADAEAVCRRFLVWDLEAEAEEPVGVKEKLGAVLGQEAEDASREE